MGLEYGLPYRPKSTGKENSICTPVCRETRRDLGRSEMETVSVFSYQNAPERTSEVQGSIPCRSISALAFGAGTTREVACCYRADLNRLTVAMKPALWVANPRRRPKQVKSIADSRESTGT